MVWCQVISRKSKCKIRVFPLCFPNIPWLLPVMYIHSNSTLFWYSCYSFLIISIWDFFERWYPRWHQRGSFVSRLIFLDFAFPLSNHPLPAIYKVSQMIWDIPSVQTLQTVMSALHRSCKYDTFRHNHQLKYKIHVFSTLFWSWFDAKWCLHWRCKPIHMKRNVLAACSTVFHITVSSSHVNLAATFVIEDEAI